MARTFEQIMTQVREEQKHMHLPPSEIAAWEDWAIDAARSEAATAAEEAFMKDLKLPKTKTALAEYDRLYAEYEKASADYFSKIGAASFHDLNTANVAVEQVDAAVDEAREKVRDAFAEETADRNTPEQAHLIGPRDPWFRDLVAKYGGD